MPGDAANPRDLRFPNLAPEVVRGYLDAPPTRLGGELGGLFDRGRGGPGG